MIEYLSFMQMCRNWISSNQDRLAICPPEARVITGRSYTDAAHYFLQEDSGVELEFSGSTVIGAKVINERKFAWFTLKYQ